MPFKFQHFNPETDYLPKRAVAKAGPRKPKKDKLIERIQLIEDSLIQLTQNSKEGMKVDIGAIFDDKPYILDSEIALTIKHYSVWALKRAKEAMINPMACSFSDSDASRILSLSNMIHFAKEGDFYSSFSLTKQIIGINSNTFGPSFLEVGLKLYLTKLDPFAFWLNKEQLINAFKPYSTSLLKYSITLIFLRYANAKEATNHNFSIARSYYYKLINTNLPSVYSNPSYENILVLMFLAFYEASLHKLNPFKNHISSAIRMAQFLRYDQLPTDMLHSKCSLNLEPLTEAYQNKQLWDLIVITSHGLGSILGEAMIRCFPNNSKYLEIIKEYSKTHFCISTKLYNEPLPILNESRQYISTILKAFKNLNDYHVRDRVKFQKVTFDSIIKLYSETEYKSFDVVDQELYLIRKDFKLTMPMSELVDNALKISKWLSVHHFSSNWITFGPVYSLLIFYFISLYPNSCHMDAMSMVSFLDCAPTLASQFLQKIQQLTKAEQLT